MFWIIPLAAFLGTIVSFAVMSAFARRPENLGLSNGRLAECPSSPNCVCTQTDESSHWIEPIPLEMDAADATKKIESIIAGMPGGRLVKSSDDYLHAEFCSRIFRFVDDVEFFVDRENRKLHFRSASRTGYSDMGANRARMEEFRTRFQAAGQPVAVGG